MAVPSDMNAGDAAPRRVADQDLFSEYLPADGTNAAVNWRDYGRSRWQLFDHATSLAVRLKPGVAPAVALPGSTLSGRRVRLPGAPVAPARGRRGGRLARNG